MSGSYSELQRIRGLLEVNRYAEARDAAATALAADPDSAKLHRLMAIALLQLNEPRPARRSAERACALAPGDPDNTMVLARALWRLRDLGAARDMSLETVRLAPHSATAHALFAQIQADLDPRSADAHIAASRAVELAPHSSHAHFAAGYVFQASGDNKRAREAYHATLAIDPNHSTALNNLGVIGGSLSESTKSYQAALAADPQHRTARANLELTLPRLVWMLWLAGAALILVGIVVTTHGSDRPSQPDVVSISAAVVVPIILVVQFWRVFRTMPPHVIRHVLTAGAVGRGRLRQIFWAVGFLVIGELSCTLTAVASFSVILLPGIAVGLAIGLTRKVTHKVKQWRRATGGRISS